MPVVEDAAQAAGADLDGVSAGAPADVSENLPCLGDGGAIVTDDDELAERARILRSTAPRTRPRSPTGYNSRLDELQAAVLRVLLRNSRDGPSGAGLAAPTSVSAWASTRCSAAHRGRAARLSPLRGALRARVARSGAATARRCTGRRPAIADPAELPATEEAARTNFALLMGTDLSEEQVRQVVEACASGST